MKILYLFLVQNLPLLLFFYEIGLWKKESFSGWVFCLFTTNLWSSCLLCVQDTHRKLCGLIRGHSEDTDPTSHCPPCPQHPLMPPHSRPAQANQNAPLPVGWPRGWQLSVTAASAGSAASGHRLEASERSPGSTYGIISVHSWLG